MNKEEWEEYITWEERVTDKLERWVKYNKPITREQAEETIDFICEQDNVIDRKIRELERYKNIIDEATKELEKLLPLCIMPNNTLIHATEKSRVIEKTIKILKGE